MQQMSEGRTKVEQPDELVDTLSVCRICLQQAIDGGDEMTSIYDRDNSNNFLYRKIESCGGIKIIIDPNLPTRICRQCNTFLTIAHKFRIICRNSDNYLRCTTLAKIDENTMAGDDDTQDTTMAKEKVPATDSANLALHTELEEDVESSYNNAMWLSDNDGVDDIDELSESQQSADSPATPSKTLDISADGAAVIRIKADSQKELHICEICGNSYSKKYALEAHMRRHRDERRYQCEICHATFLFNFQLVRHIRKHTGARPYSCQYCNRSFTDRSALVKHERVHRNERPFSCNTCGKTFTYSNVRKVHMLTHTGEKPYNCGICGKRFTRAHHLRAHLETLLHQSDPRAPLLLKQIKPETYPAVAVDLNVPMTGAIEHVE